MKIRIETQGLVDLAAALDRTVERGRSPGSEVMQDTVRVLTSAMRANIETGGRHAGESWPPLSPVTRSIRQYYGHGDQPLVRRGDLLRSISGRAVNDSSAEATATHPAAGIVDQGGTNRAGRTIPARPFAALAPADNDSIANLVADAMVEELRNG